MKIPLQVLPLRKEEGFLARLDKIDWNLVDEDPTDTYPGILLEEGQEIPTKSIHI